MNNRFKSYPLWIAVIALIPMWLQALKIDILPKNYEELATATLGVFVLLGIVNDPTTTNKGYKDDK